MECCMAGRMDIAFNVLILTKYCIGQGGHHIRMIGLQRVAMFSRSSQNVSVFRMRQSYPGPVYPACGSGPRVACVLSQVCRLWTDAGGDANLLRTRWKNLLQNGLPQVRARRHHFALAYFTLHFALFSPCCNETVRCADLFDLLYRILLHNE